MRWRLPVKPLLSGFSPFFGGWHTSPLACLVAGLSVIAGQRWRSSDGNLHVGKLACLRRKAVTIMPAKDVHRHATHCRARVHTNTKPTPVKTWKFSGTTGNQRPVKLYLKADKEAGSNMKCGRGLEWQPIKTRILIKTNIYILNFNIKASILLFIILTTKIVMFSYLLYLCHTFHVHEKAKKKKLFFVISELILHN